MVFLVDLVASYLFEKSMNVLNLTTYHSIYHNDGLVVLKVKKRVQEIKYCLAEFQRILDKAEGNQHLQFTVEVWKNDMNLPPSANKGEVQIVANDEFPFLYMKILLVP